MTLTAEQLSVVNLVSGRHLVLAPPGPGKTEMLSQRIIRGASTDFVRLESAADAEHEETIRTILALKDLPDEYERRLRAILFARARRKM